MPTITGGITIKKGQDPFDNPKLKAVMDEHGIVTPFDIDNTTVSNRKADGVKLRCKKTKKCKLIKTKEFVAPKLVVK